MSKNVEIEAGGKKVAVSNLEKVPYPEVGFAKGQVIDYYLRMAPVLPPHLNYRPITLKRYSDGVDGFFTDLGAESGRPGAAHVFTARTCNWSTSGAGLDLDPGPPADILLRCEAGMWL